MKRHTHLLAATACALTVALTAGACTASDNAVSGGGATGSAGPDGPAIDGGTLKVGLDRPFTKLDPADGTLTSMPMMILANALYDPLMVNGDNGVVKPYLAQAFTSDADATGWTLKLREGVTFSDGKPLDAQAVVDHVKRLAKPESTCTCAADAATIATLEANGPATVDFTLKAPNAAFPSLFTRSLGYVSQAPTGAAPAVGSGPYTVESVQPGVSVTVARNPAYWGAKGHADKIVYKVLPDSDSRYQSLRSGDADLIWTETPAQLKQAGGAGLRTATGPGSTSTVLLNTKAAPFDDPRVRRALQYAVDREAVEKVVYLGQGQVSNGPIGSASPYRAAGASGYPAHDPAKARALLADAGHSDLSFEYLVDNRPESQQRATTLQQMFAEAGVKMTIKPVDTASLNTAMFQRKFQVLDFVTSMFGDTDTALNSLFTADSPYNFTGYGSPEASRAIGAGRAEPDAAKRGTSYGKAADAVVRDAPMLFLTENPAGFLATAEVGGLPDVSRRTVISVSPATLWVTK
ncbi:ABC transporter substrate-binding protein [Streptomyces sp. BE308]|uniref:ABC transporter substrate-binding protein n=1 Tax=Streptomyces sp. BE308 TaxID=3002529 RepID=UPI002E786826|nr:ABC transporter substrate-binding protein [Streptomyces sp. BE308]MEE1792889.1 ABC transporter substrate-binding protein [Streptomyces sp. BE308]